MKDDNRPIGFFDSGMGGITVLKPGAALLPRETMIYYGDNANAPYGLKPPEAIMAHTLAAVDALLARDIKLLVIACNTATSVAAQALRTRLDIPVVAMEPALKPASRMEGDGQIIVLATPATLSLPRFQDSMALYGRRAVAVPVFGLVERIEAGDTAGPAVRQALEAALRPALARRTDAIVLGCTHYPFVRPTIEAIAGPAVRILDGTVGTLAQMHRLLAEGDLLRRSGEGGVSFVSSSPDPGVIAAMERLYADFKPTDLPAGL